VRSWSPDQIDLLERAIVRGWRVQLMRRGTDFSVIPRSLRSVGANEVLTAMHTTTGEEIEFLLDDIDEWDVMR